MTKPTLDLLQNIIKHIDDGIIIVDTDMCVIYCNNWVEQRRNKSSNEILGKNLIDVFPEIDNSRLSTAIKETLNNFVPQFLSNLFHDAPITLYPAVSAFGHTGRTPLQLDINTIPFKYQSSTVCIIQIRDVSLSSRRETALEHEILNRSIIERSLRESESRYRLLAENTSDIIIKTDDKFIINYISPNCSYHLGFDDIELNNTNITTYIHDDDIVTFESTLGSETHKTKTSPLRHRIRNNEGVYEWYESTINSYTSNNTHPKRGYVLVIRNIAERIEQEKEHIKMQLQLDRNQRMQSIGHLTGGIAHKFNNILTSVIGYTDLCYTLQEPIDINTLHKYLNEIKQSGQSSKELVIQLLEYSQEQNIQLKPIDIYSTVKTAINFISATFPSSIEIELTAQQNLPLVKSNKVQLEQILLNLCTNAKDAIGKTGTIIITLSQQHHANSSCHSCHEQFSGEYVSLEVKDTGVGINRDELELIFQPFFTSKGRAEATGLGLSVVHGIVHSQHGHVLVDSDNDGTRFQILLPSYPEN